MFNLNTKYQQSTKNSGRNLRSNFDFFCNVCRNALASVVACRAAPGFFRTVALNILFFNAFGGSAELFVLVYCCACFLLFLRFLFLFVFNLRAADVFVFFFKKRPKRIS